MTAESLESKKAYQNRYIHKRYVTRRRILRLLIKWVGFPLLVKLDGVEGVEKIPQSGPAILMINHIAFVDPIMVLQLVPRDIVPMAKIEVYHYPVVGIFPRIWGVIPVRREEADRQAVQRAMDVLRAGEIILVAPESTRSPQLQTGKEGVAYLASRSGAPVVPIAITGTVGFPALRFTRRWRKPGVRIRFGSPFRYKSRFEKADRNQLRKMTDEAMYVLSGMLPERQRGVYADLSQATQETLEWL